MRWWIRSQIMYWISSKLFLTTRLFQRTGVIYRHSELRKKLQTLVPSQLQKQLKFGVRNKLSWSWFLPLKIFQDLQMLHKLLQVLQRWLRLMELSSLQHLLLIHLLRHKVLWENILIQLSIHGKRRKLKIFYQQLQVSIGTHSGTLEI